MSVARESTDVRYYRIVYPAFSVLVILSSSPSSRDKDLFLLSVVAALARRLIDLRVHANVSSISRVLGRRLMTATRKLAATRLPGESVADSAAELDPESLGLGPFSHSFATLVPTYGEGIFGMLDTMGFGDFGVGDLFGDQ